MKIKNKLIRSTTIIAAIPLVLLMIIIMILFSSLFYEKTEHNIDQNIRNQATILSSIINGVLTNNSTLSANENVISAVEKSDITPVSSEEIEDIVEIIEISEEGNDSFLNSFIVNNNGKIIVSTDSDETGVFISNYKELSDVALQQNNLSDLFMSNINEFKVPVFNVVKSIYSDDNERVGLICSTYDISNLKALLVNIRTEKYVSVSIVDSKGQICYFPFTDISKASELTDFYQFNDEIDAIVNKSNHDILNKVIYKQDEASKPYYYVTPITSRGWTNSWYVIATGNSVLMTTDVNTIILIIIIIFFVLLVIVIIISSFFANRFSSPVSNMLSIVSNKKNNVHANFNIDTDDEFHDIGVAFNTLFDDVFESEQRYRTIVEMTDNIVFEINNKKNTVYVSKNFNKKFGLRPANDSIDESFIYNFRVHKDDQVQYKSAWDKLLGPANFLNGEFRVKSIYGEFIWIKIKCTKFFGRDEKPAKIIGVIVDIDREKKSEIRLLFRASYDNLTQLYNRETFLKSLTNDIETSYTKKALDAIMFIDLDDFKAFNDHYGHACGDEVLKFVADVLKEITFERGYAGRFGGDEFVICITNLTLYGDAGQYAQEIIDLLDKGFYSPSTNQTLSVKCSIGIAFLKESGKNTNEIIAAADEAMYTIKKHGKSNYAYAKSIKYTDNEDDFHSEGNSSVVLPAGKPIDSETITSNE